MAELARGGAIQEQVAPGQDKSTQDNLYAAALSHFVRAARHAVAAQSYPELVVRSAEAMWNCSLHLSGSSVSRRLARSSLRCILACMRESGIVSAASLQVEANLLGLLLECFTDDGHFQAGLSYVDRALKDLNARDGGEDDSKAAEKVLRRVMLEGRVKFLSRLGRSSGAGLKVEGDAAAKANVWATLARTRRSGPTIIGLSKMFGLREWSIRTGRILGRLAVARGAKGIKGDAQS